MYTAVELFALEYTMAAEYLAQFHYPWEALAGLADCIYALGGSLDGADYIERAPGVWAHRSAEIAATAQLCAPCIIGPRTEVRHCAFIRGAALVGADCVVGNSVELKNAILFDHAQVPHFNYVGDSILGYYAHMGAGAITSNVKSDGAAVVVHGAGEDIPTGLLKFGALLGDRAEIGCNSVLNPGTVIGRDSTVYPLSCVRGMIPPNSIFKTGGVIVEKRPK